MVYCNTTLMKFGGIVVNRFMKTLCKSNLIQLGEEWGDNTAAT